MQINVSDEVTEQIRLKADILDVAGEYMNLVKKGKSYWGLCPFHDEKTPSFSVNREKQIYHCFGCGAGGDVFSFIMNRENLSFVETLVKLAARYSIDVPRQPLNDEQKERRQKVDKIIAVNELAVKYFNYLLNQSQGIAVRKYLTTRGITQAEIDKFQLGFALDSWEDFCRLAKNKGFSEAELVGAGLAVNRDKGTGVYNRFRNRLMFTINNPAGQPVGFGGRVLDDSLPKYLNTPETLVFNKRNNLYGLNLAGQSIRQQGYVIIMEGYMDVIAAGQFGIENVVASLGTAFTKEQALLLKRHTNKVYICYDADTAGEKAVLRGLDILREEKCQVKVVNLPKGLDPDDFIRQEGKETFLKLVLTDAKNLIEYKLDQAIRKVADESGNWKAETFDLLKTDLLKTENAIEREEYIRVVANKLEIPEKAIREELAKHRPLQKNGIYRDKKAENRNTNNGSESLGISRLVLAHEQAEKLLFLNMVEDKSTRELVLQKLGHIFFSTPILKHLISLAIRKWELGQEVYPAWLLTNCEKEADKNFVAKLFHQDLPDREVREKLVLDCIEAIIQRQKQVEIAGWREKLKEAETAGDLENMKSILAIIQRLMG